MEEIATEEEEDTDLEKVMVQHDKEVEPRLPSICKNTQVAGGRGGMAPPRMGNLPPAFEFNTQATRPPNLPHSNIVKKYTNWNVCFSCGFDVEDGHTLQTCPGHWRKMNHQEGFTCENLRQWINAGYDLCTKGMHNLQFPSF